MALRVGYRDAHDDEGVGQLVAGVLQPRVVFVELMSQALLNIFVAGSF